MTGDERTIYEFVLGFVDGSEDHNIDETSVQSALANIIEKCEKLAMEIEAGKHERFDDRGKRER